MVLLDEISGGCSRLPCQHTVSSAGHVGHPRPHVAVRPGGQAASPMPKETPHPRFSSPLCFLKHFDHSHGHCIFILMLRFFLNLFDLNGCGEVKNRQNAPQS